MAEWTWEGYDARKAERQRLAERLSHQPVLRREPTPAPKEVDQLGFKPSSPAAGVAAGGVGLMLLGGLAVAAAWGMSEYAEAVFK